MLGERAWLRVVTDHEGPGVELGRIFRSQGLRTEAGFFAFLNQDGLVLKLPPNRVEHLVATGAGEPFTSGQRVMREWVVVPRSRTRRWSALTGEALAFSRRAGRAGRRSSA
jgi:hypothetical protein